MGHPEDVESYSIHSQSQEFSDSSSFGEGPVHDYNDPEKALTPQLSQAANRPPLSRIATSIGTTGTTDPNYEVDWEEDDSENPRNWPLWYKGIVIGFISWSTWSVVMYSTSYTTGLLQLDTEFNTNDTVATLGLTTYLLGLAVGSVILAPISEIYGRKPVYVVSLILFVLLVIPCALATSLSEVIVVRFFGALAGSALISNSPGTVSDIISDEYRALAFSIWSIGPLNGPTFGPVIGGFSTQYLGFRWTNWIVMILSAVSWIFVCIMKETYSPALLVRRAAHRRKETGDSRWWSRYDQKASFISLLKINLSRPFVMAVTEPICIFWNLYVAVIYGILYLCFVAYPIVFTGIRGWPIGISGLAFVGQGVGSLITIACEPLWRRLINSHQKDPDTGKPFPEAMISVVSIAAFLVPLGQLWFSWTCVPPVHWIWSILAGIPFGAGNTTVFIYATNYIAGSYGIYAASALAGNTVMRSLLGGTLPLAGPSMYARLGAHWAGTLLGLLQLALIPIPVIFYLYGGRIREKSTLIRSMQQNKERLEGKREKWRLKERQQAGEAMIEEGVTGPEEVVERIESEKSEG